MQISLTTEPMRHQHDAVAHLGRARVGGAFMDMGTGKSFVAMMLAKSREEKIDRVFWGCPCSLRKTIVREILKHTTSTEDDIHILTGRSKEADILRATWIVFGIESIGQSDAATLKLARHVSERSMMIVDESTYIKGPRAKRTDRLTRIGAICRYRLVMTGTPLTQGLVDLFSQMKFLSEKILGYRSFWSFEQAHIRYRYEKRRRLDGTRYEVKTDHIIGYDDVKTLVENVAPYVYQVRKEECLDLPDKIFVEQQFDMTDEQAARYEQVKSELILNRPVDDFFGSGGSFYLFRLFGALQKVTAGLVDGMRHDRIDTMMRFVEQIPADEPVVVWTKYKRAGDAIQSGLRERYGDVATLYDGRFNDDQRDRHLQDWRDGKKRFLLATQDSGGHGLTLVECAWTLFYADGFKYSNRLQAEDRFHRIGQTRRPTIGSLVCNKSIDERIYDNHRTKGSEIRAFQEGLEREKRSNVKDRLMAFVGGRP